MKEDESTTNHILKIWLPKLSKAAPVIDLTINFREGFTQESQGATWESLRAGPRFQPLLPNKGRSHFMQYEYEHQSFLKRALLLFHSLTAWSIRPSSASSNGSAYILSNPTIPEESHSLSALGDVARLELRTILTSGFVCLPPGPNDDTRSNACMY